MCIRDRYRQDNMDKSNNQKNCKHDRESVSYTHLDVYKRQDESCEKEIKKELEKKLDRMVMRDLFGKSKTAPTEEEREQARKEYLDRRGVPESFRW